METIGSLFNSITNEKKPLPKIYSKVVLQASTKKKILSYQEKHIINLIEILLKHNIALDNSDAGVGKTYVAAAICKELGKRPIIVCPKTLIFNWIVVLDYFGIEAYDIVNYETMRNGKTYKNNKFNSRKKSPYVDVLDFDPENPHKPLYKWNLPKDAIVIFDEVHRCQNASSDNGKLLISAKQLSAKKIPVLLLSATICEDFNDMKVPFYLFGLIPNTRNFSHYIKTLWNKYPNYKVKKSSFNSAQECKRAKNNAQAMIIYEEIKEFCSRIRIKDLGDKFPDNQICVQQFLADDADKISNAYKQIFELLKKIKKKKKKSVNHLAKIQKLKQEIELIKVPIFIEQAQLYLAKGNSVIIFVNYLDTLDVLAQELGIKCQIHGRQTLEERNNAINMFQSNQERIIISQIRAGGTGTNLHDLNGNYPRVSLINNPDSAKNFLQALGRAARSEAKSKVLQRIIFVANVEYETRMMENIKKKLANISAINDGNIDGYQMGIIENEDNFDDDLDIIDNF